MQNPIGSHAHILKSRRIVETGQTTISTLLATALSVISGEDLNIVKYKNSKPEDVLGQKKDCSHITMMAPYFGGDVGRS